MKAGWRRRLMTGTNATIVAIAVVAVVGLLIGLAGRYRVRWDLTEDGSSTLLPETRAALQMVDSRGQVVEITAFSAQKRDNEAFYRDRTVRDLLQEIDYASTAVETRFVDFDRERLTAESMGVSSYGTIVVEGLGDRVDIGEREVFRRTGKGKERSLEFLGETAVTRAISQIVTRQGRTVCFLSGHGERRMIEAPGQGSHVFSALVEGQGWTAKGVDLLRDREAGEPIAVPVECNALLVAGPAAPMTGEEEAALRSFLADGGSLGFWLEPGGFVPDLVERLGVTRPDGVVLDRVAIYPYEDRPLLRFGSHPITADLAEGELAVVVARAAPLEAHRLEGQSASELLKTSREGWVERGDERPSTYGEGEDGAGPVPVALAVEVRPPHPISRRGAVVRVLVVGDSDVVSDELMAEGPGNATFAVNGVRWLLGEDDRMSRVGRPTEVRRLTMSAEQLAMIRWLVVGLLPLIAVASGGAVWASRRGRR